MSPVFTRYECPRFEIRLHALPRPAVLLKREVVPVRSDDMVLRVLWPKRFDPYAAHLLFREFEPLPANGEIGRCGLGWRSRFESMLQPVDHRRSDAVVA
jgi:hypothetical protein